MLLFVADRNSFWDMALCDVTTDLVFYVTGEALCNLMTNVVDVGAIKDKLMIHGKGRIS